MVPSAYHAYFGGCASVAGTLIGLLFVAISVSPHKDTGRRAPLSFQVQAGAAFTKLIDALVGPSPPLSCPAPRSLVQGSSGPTRPSPSVRPTRNRNRAKSPRRESGP